MAFLAEATALGTIPASYSPFDTGSLRGHACPRDPEKAWGDADKDRFLAEHLGCGGDAPDFAADYVAAHFHDPVDYVRRSQHSEPDFPVYHGLASKNGDRRAWSIEVQLHDDLPLDDQHLESIVLGEHDLLADIPDELIAKSVVAVDPSNIGSEVTKRILSGYSP